MMENMIKTSVTILIISGVVAFAWVIWHSLIPMTQREYQISIEWCNSNGYTDIVRNLDRSNGLRQTYSVHCKKPNESVASYREAQFE